MSIESIDVVLYTCTFLLPGFIIKSVMDTLIPPVKFNETKYFLSCLFYSIINCAICSWIYILLLNNFEMQSVWFWILLVVITIIAAIVVALCISVIKQKNIVGCIFSKFNINSINYVPTAWDFYFSKQNESWVIVTLKSEKTIYGKYSVNSFASSDSEERDLYIEQTYKYIEEQPWGVDNTSNGILISKDEIETIEFLK